MEVMMAKKQPLSKLAEPVRFYPQELVNVRIADKEKAQNDKDVVDCLRACCVLSYTDRKYTECGRP